MRFLTLDEDEVRRALDDLTIAEILAHADPEQPAHTIREGILGALLRFDTREREATAPAGKGA